MKEDITINNFFIFNSLYGSKEGEEHKKILYYYPKDEDINIQITSVSLAQAIIQFTETFKPSSPVNSLHTQRKRQLYFQPEGNFWIIMTLNVPFLEKTNDGVSCREYLENDIQNNVYESVLKQTYSMFKLFNGTINYVLQKNDISALKNKLEQFFDVYLMSLKLAYCDILNVFNGIQFLPLDKQNFLNVQCFVNELECVHPIIDYTLFMYNDHVIWSGLNPDDLQILYHYLVNILLPARMETELQGGSMPRNAPSPFVNHGRFINGPPNLKTAKNIGKLTKVFLSNNNNEQTIYYMLIYRTRSTSICIFINAENELTLHLLRELEDFMGPKLLSIKSDIAEYCSQQISVPSNISEHCPKFIYFNKMNLAYKSTTHLDNKQTGNLSCPKEAVKIIADINNKRPILGYAGEIIVKTMNDYWVVGKISNLREFYVAIQHKKASLIDISDEVKKLCETELKGIFFHDM